MEVCREVAGHHLAVVAAVFQVEVGVLGGVEAVEGGELAVCSINDYKTQNNSSP